MDERQFGGQRREARVTVNHEFRNLDQFIMEYVQNISKSGVFIKSDDPLPNGTEVNLKFTVIMDELETLEGVGKVVRVVKPGESGTPGMGVVFTELTSYSNKLLEKLLSRS
ncbi:MAG: PilZ domain-containing protein [Deltaproteobacteria bacterium]|nr:PilZ domain-containing protein [Deltaproteobacteria bacterium]MBW1873522.1 PilZ domain-containing protein [Deltaproteobacteria bacterium]